VASRLSSSKRCSSATSPGISGWTKGGKISFVDSDEFWRLVELARAGVDDVPGQDGDALAKALTELLVRLPPAQIEAFGVEFHRLSAAADRWDVWGAAYLIGGGCSDDAFTDFRSGLIAAGREWYDRALADPDALASHPAVAEAAEWDDDSAIFAELVGYAGFQAYRQVTGVGWAIETPEGQTAGQRWDFDDDDEMRRRLPRLSALFVGWPANEGCRC
jgi:hypothetical protein